MQDDSFIRAISEIAEKAAQPKLLDTGDSRRKAYLIGGQVEHFEVYAPHSFYVDDVHSMLAACSEFGTLEESTVWYSDNSVVLCMNREFRDRVKLGMQYTEAWGHLLALASGKHTHQAFMRMLRTSLKEHVADDVIQSLASIRVGSSGSATSTQAKGRDQGMREFDRELQNAADVPDAFTVTLSVYQASPLCDYDVQVTVHLDIDLESMQILTWIGDSDLYRARTDALSHLHELLEASGLPVFHGSPGE